MEHIAGEAWREPELVQSDATNIIPSLVQESYVMVAASTRPPTGSSWLPSRSGPTRRGCSGSDAGLRSPLGRDHRARGAA